MLRENSIQGENIPAGKFPPTETQADLFYALPELHYPKSLNAAVELVDRHIEAGKGENVAIYFEDESITYRDLQTRVNRLGNALQDLGVEPGERVFVRFPNRPEYAVSCLAVQKIGAIPVPSMKLLQAKECTYVIEDSGATVALVHDGLLEPVEAAHETCESLQTIIVANREGITHEYLDYDDICSAAAPKLDAADTRRDDLSMLAYTSGTTGRPKGTIHTHRQMLAIVDGYARYCLKPTADDIFSGNPPIAFTFGYGVLVAFPLRFGASTVIIENAEPIDLIETIDEYGVTVLGSIPTAYNQMLNEHADQIAAADLSSLRIGISAGEPLSPSTFERVKSAFGIELLDGLGSTEMLHIFVSHRLGDEIDPSVTGYPVPGYECKVIDPDTGDELDYGEPGLLAVRGPTGVTYWGRPEKQKLAVSDGWSLPGDVFVRTEDDRFEYKSRRDDLIISSGYNIPGPEVESVLQERDEVYETAVIGSPHEERGTVVKAFVVLTDGIEPTEETTSILQDHVKSQIAPYKYPRRIEFVSELPKTETGKIRRNLLREREQENGAASAP